jgi:hypothetical protein
MLIQAIRCPGDIRVSQAELIAKAVARIVLEDRYLSDPLVIHYRSAEEFYAQNPDCCLPAKDKSEVRTLNVMGTGNTVTLLYKKYPSSERAYIIRRVSFGPCAKDMEESQIRVNQFQYEQELRSLKRGA